MAIKQNQIIGDLNEESLLELMNFSFGCTFPYNNDVTMSTDLLFTLVYLGFICKIQNYTLLIRPELKR